LAKKNRTNIKNKESNRKKDKGEQIEQKESVDKETEQIWRTRNQYAKRGMRTNRRNGKR